MTTRESIELGIASHKARENDAKSRATSSIARGEYWTAQIAIQEAAQHAACIEELEFQIEAMEVENDD